MSPLSRAEVLAGICPGRLVVTRRRHRLSKRVARNIRPLDADIAAAIAMEATGANVTAVLSNHFVRYCVLPWSGGLTSEADWLGYARHNFESAYGAAITSAWQMRVSDSGRGRARIATAVDTVLADALRSIPGVVSIRPYLMHAFNARRNAIPESAAWFVVHEEGRVTLALISEGQWQSVRTRRINGDWPGCLPAILDQEAAIRGAPENIRVFLWGEVAVPERLERYDILDVTLPRGAPSDLRAYAMASR